MSESNTFCFVTPTYSQGPCLSRIVSIFGMEVSWDNRHQPHTSLLW